MRIGQLDRDRLGSIADDRVYDVTGQVTSQLRGGPLEAHIRSEHGALEIQGPGIPVAEARWRAPLPRPGKIIGAPANYYDHADEMPDSATIFDWGLFLKAPTSVIGPGDVVRLPYLDKRTDYEGELAVVIGKGGKKIPVESALDHVVGYSCLMDITGPLDRGPLHPQVLRHLHAPRAMDRHR